MNSGSRLIRKMSGLLALSYFAERHAEVAKNGFIKPEELVDPMRVPPRVLQALNQPEAIELTMLEDLEAFIVETFPVEQALKKESARGVWNPISNATKGSIDKPDRDEGVSPYTSTN